MLAAAVAALWLCAPPARAGVSTTADWSTGNGYRGWDGRVRLDFDTRGEWSANAGYAWAHSKQGTESFSKQVTAGFEHNPDDAWSFRGTLTGWKEYLSDVDYFGPSWGFTYLATTRRPTRRRRVFRKPDAREPGAPLESRSDEPPEELWGVSFDNDLFFYHAPQSSAPRTIKLGRSLVTAPPSPNALNVTQWHPYVELEKPLFEQNVVPSITVGHYFYTNNPSVIEEHAGQPRFSAAAGSLSSLAGGFFKTNGEAAVDVLLPLRLRLHGALSAQQQASDSTWAITQELSLKSRIGEVLSLTARWDRTIQVGVSSDQYTAGLTLYF